MRGQSWLVSALGGIAVAAVAGVLVSDAVVGAVAFTGSAPLAVGLVAGATAYMALFLLVGDPTPAGARVGEGFVVGGTTFLFAGVGGALLVGMDQSTAMLAGGVAGAVTGLASWGLGD